MGAIWSVLLASLAVVCLLIFARSSRFGSSGPIGIAIGAVSIPIAIALLWLLALTIGWWTLLVLVVASTLAGLSVDGNNADWWVTAQPTTGLLVLILGCAARALHFWR